MRLLQSPVGGYFAAQVTGEDSTVAGQWLGDLVEKREKKKVQGKGWFYHRKFLSNRDTHPNIHIYIHTLITIILIKSQKYLLHTFRIKST